MEEFIINKKIEMARANGYETVLGEYLMTAKNAMVANIYEKLGFERLSDTKFCVSVDGLKNKTYIAEE